MKPNDSTPDSFCLVPWTSIYIRPDGRMSACCYYDKAYQSSSGEDLHLYKDNISDGFHSHTAQQLRKNLFAGVKDQGCSLCWREEAMGQKSKRQHAFYGYDKEKEEILSGQYPLNHPILFDISTGNICNLKCRICNATASSMWLQESVDLGIPLLPLPQSMIELAKEPGVREKIKHWPMSNKKFWLDVEAWLPQIKEFNFIGGEPMLSKDHFALLQKSVALGYSKLQTIRYNTNGTVFPESSLEELYPKFKCVQIWFSIDGTKQQFEYQRHGANWEKVLNNVEKFLPYKNNSYAICLTVSNFNVFYLFDYLDFWLERNVPVFLGNVMGNELNMKCMPTAIKKKILTHLQAHDIKKYDSILINKIEPFFSLLEVEGDPEHWQQFLSSLKQHDNYRNENYAASFPEAARIYDY